MRDALATAVRYLGCRSVSELGSEMKGDEKEMRLTTEWAKVLVATLAGLAVHALAG